MYLKSFLLHKCLPNNNSDIFLYTIPYSTKGYLYSSTVDYLTTLQPSLCYTWLLITIGWLLPNILIIIFQATVVIEYRWVVWLTMRVVEYGRIFRRNNCEVLQAMQESVRSSSTKEHMNQRILVIQIIYQTVYHPLTFTIV